MVTQEIGALAGSRGPVLEALPPGDLCGAGQPFCGAHLPPPSAPRPAQAPPTWASQVCFVLGKTRSEQSAQTVCVSVLSGKHSVVSCVNSSCIYSRSVIAVDFRPARGDMTGSLVTAQVAFYYGANSPAAFSLSVCLSKQQILRFGVWPRGRASCRIFPHFISVESGKA